MKKTINPAKILIIDDELPIREVLSASLRDDGHLVQTAQDADTGLKALRDFQPEIVFLDIWMPGSLDGIEVLTTARKQFPQVEFVMISGHGTIETAVKATKLGAWTCKFPALVSTTRVFGMKFLRLSRGGAIP